MLKNTAFLSLFEIPQKRNHGGYVPKASGITGIVLEISGIALVGRGIGICIEYVIIRV